MNRGGAPQADDSLMTLILVVVLVVGVLWGGWVLFHEQISLAVSWLKGGQARVVAWLGVTDYLDGVLAYVDTTPPAEMKPLHLYEMSHYVGQVTRWAWAPLLVVLAVAVVLWAPVGRYRGRLDLDKLIAFQALRWPAILPIVKVNPGRQREAGWARALKPVQWLERHDIPIAPDGMIDPDLVARAFADQLGPPWDGIRRLPSYLAALAVAFALTATLDRKPEAEDLLARLAALWASDMTPRKREQAVRRLLAPYLADTKLLQPAEAVARRHAWSATALAALMEWAIEEGGILNSGLFVWLRTRNRTVWYVLNNVGRRTFHVEGAGAIAHLQAERAAGVPLDEPQVASAIEGLLEYLAERGYLEGE